MSMERLEILQASFPFISPDVSQIVEYFNGSLWHELTLKFIELTSLPQLQNGEILVDIFESCISPIGEKLNPLSVGKIGLACSKNADPAKGSTFLHSIALSVKDSSMQAFTLLRCGEASMALKSGNVTAAKEILDECFDFLKQHEVSDIAAIVHATYYCSQSAYLKTVENYDDFYKTALLHLVYSDIEKIPIDEQQKWAFDIGISALLGKHVYNFGELLGNPVITSLDGTNLKWIHELLTAFNKGNLAQYTTIMQQNGAAMSNVKELSNKDNFLQKKMQVMALLNYLFTLTQNTVVHFKEIAQITLLPFDQVEHLVLKALSLGVIKGMIDQVSSTVEITWVHARVLDREEIEAMASKVASWSDNVRHTLDLVSATSAQLQDQQ